MYDAGESYASIASRLGVHIMTVLDWRKKLGLPARSSGGRTRSESYGPWWDEPITYRRPKQTPHGIPTWESASPKKILESIATPLSLSRGDIGLILGRMQKIIHLKQNPGRAKYKLLLREAYLYKRSPQALRPPIGIRKFVGVCNAAGYELKLTELQRLVRVSSQTGSIPPDPNAAEWIKRQEFLLRQEFQLSQEETSTGLSIAEVALSDQSVSWRAPNSIAAAAVYLGAGRHEHRIEQWRICSYFGITEPTLRTMIDRLIGIPQVRVILRNGTEVNSPA